MSGIRDVEKTRDSITFHLIMQREQTREDSPSVLGNVSNRRIHTSNSQLLEDIHGNIIHAIHIHRIKT